MLRTQYGSGRIRNPRPQTRMRPAIIVVSNPFQQNPSQMPFARGNHEIQTLSPDSAYQTFTISICGWCSHRSLQNLQGHCFNALIQVGGINAIAVVNRKAPCFVFPDCFSESLRASFRRRMIGHIKVNDPSAPDLHQDKHIENSEDIHDENHEDIQQVLYCYEHVHGSVGCHRIIVCMQTFTPVEHSRRNFYGIQSL